MTYQLISCLILIVFMLMKQISITFFWKKSICLLSDISRGRDVDGYQTNFSESKKKLHFKQIVHKCGAKWSIYLWNILHFGEKVLKLVSPLFVEAFLAEYYVDWATQFFNPMNYFYGPVHKWCHWLWEEKGSAKRWHYSISLFSIMGAIRGGRGQKSQNMGDIFYGWPLSINF